MKKKTTTKSAVAKTSRRKTSGAGSTVVFHRIVIISACLSLFVVGILAFNRHNVMQSVAGTSIMKGLFMQATIGVPSDIPNAGSYTLYYKETNEKEFTNSVKLLSPEAQSYTISYLKKGASYEYRFAVVDKSGKEVLFSEILPLTNLQPM